MTDSDTAVDSADQSAWTDLARVLRSRIEQRLRSAKALSADDLAKLADAARLTLGLGVNALTFDAEVEDSQRKLTLWGGRD